MSASGYSRKRPLSPGDPAVGLFDSFITTMVISIVILTVIALAVSIAVPGPRRAEPENRLRPSRVPVDSRL